MTGDQLIGNENGLPWEEPDEYQHFLDSIRGETVIMGRRSWELFGDDMKSAHNVVITHGSTVDDAHLAASLDTAIDIASNFSDTVYIAGGESVYTQALLEGRVDEMLLSYVKGQYEGDHYFPDFDVKKWDIVETEDKGSYTTVRYRKL